MLIELRIENLAVIDRLAVRVEPGLSVLTGETGAGKSIVVGALSLLLGERASTESVRAGAPRAVVEAAFDVRTMPDVRAMLAERGIEVEEDLVVLRREIVVEGRSRAWINGAASTAGFVGQVGRLLVDLHGQHDHQSLLEPSEQREILDAFGGCIALRQDVKSAYARVRDCEERLNTLETQQRDAANRAERLREQADEIEKARLRPGEESELDVEAHRLSHAEELSTLAARLHDQLYAAEHAVAGRIDELRRTLAQLLKFDPALTDWQRTLDDAYFGVQELGREMGEYAARIEADPRRLEAIRLRQDQLYRLKQRYGATVEEVIEAGRRARAELERLAGATAEQDAVARELEAARRENAQLCAALSDRRGQAAQRLDDEMNAALPQLGLAEARFVTARVPLAEPSSHGSESVEFRVTVNAGFEPAALSRVASGGELSRIMLALKSILARQDHVPTLIFDEIDAGTGGRAAHRVAERLQAVAAHHQVLVVTHLAQVASRANHHLLVDKRSDGERASVDVAALDGDARVREIARLLGGDPESRVSQAHARELLAAAPA